MASGQPEKALELYRQELKITVKAVEADPKNRKYHEELNIPLRKLTNLLHQLNWDAEAKAVEEIVSRTLSQVQSQQSKGSETRGRVNSSRCFAHSRPVCEPTPYVGWDKRQRWPTIHSIWGAYAGLVPPYKFTNWPAVMFCSESFESLRYAV